MKAILSCALAAPLLAASLAVHAAPCDAPEYRQFDFWVGEWNVHTPDGKQVGTNSITREYGGCVLHERYTTARTYAGESLNTFDAGRRVWHQSWVDTGGSLLLLEGGLQGASMVMEGATIVGDKTIRHRITWTPNADGSVRQWWQSAGADGEWRTSFDGLYKRK